MNYPQVKCKADKISDHPWVFRMHLQPPAEKIANGAVVDLVANNGKFLARGTYNGHARIGFRVLTRDAKVAVGAEFFRDKIKRCIDLRRETFGLDQTGNAYRLVNSEGDGLSGLVVDRYNDIIVLEFYSAGMYHCRDHILTALKAEFPGAKFFWFAEAHVQKQESFNCIWSDDTPISEVTEFGVKFAIDCSLKHKTGFYADQRDNRKALAEMSRGKSVLDLCTFAGGFALAAKVAGKAARVVGVELDPSAVELARKNAQLNNAAVEFVSQSFADYVETTTEQFDVVIFDPPKQTKNKDDVQTALRRYSGMNRSVLKVVKPGGLLVTCSCSGLISENDFLHALRRAASDAGRSMKVIKISGAGADHPFAISAPEGRYLKVVWAIIDPI